MFGLWKTKTAELVQDTQAFLEAETARQSQLREKLIIEFASGKIKRGQDLAKLLTDADLTLAQLCNEAERRQAMEVWREVVALRPQHEAAIREADAERATAMETRDKEIQAAHLKCRTTCMAQEERIAVAQRGLTDADNARAKLLEQSPHKESLRQLSASGQYASQQLHGEYTDSYREQRRYSSLVEYLQNALFNAIGNPDKQKKLEAELATAAAQLAAIEAHIREWEGRIQQVSVQVQRLEADTLMPKQVSA